LIAVLVCVVAASTLMLAAAGSAFAAGGKTGVAQKAPAGKIANRSRPLELWDHFGW
jgi:hypothetical protein